MEHYDPSRRSYAPTSYPAQQPQQPAAQTAGPYTTPGSVERFRQSNYLQSSPTAAQTSSRASHDAQQLYNFSQGVQYATGTSMPASQLQQYGQEYQPQEPRQQTQQYQQYGTGVMYGVQQGQQQAQAAYDQVPTFRQSRPGTAPETLPSQFGEPPTNQYYLAGNAVPTSAPATDLAAPQLPSQYSQTAYAQPGSSTQQSYAMLDPAQSAAGYSAYNQQTPYATAQPQQQADSVDQMFNQYQLSIRTIFTNAQNGTLRESPDQLIRISQYLLGRAEGLGLTRDDEALHDDRIRLWDEFNRAWLATLQRQHDLTQNMIQSGQALHDPQSIISTQGLEQLARELVRLCDDVEKHGLVDYQMGVAEENIMDLLLRCLSLLEVPSDRNDESTSRPQSSSAIGGQR